MSEYVDLLPVIVERENATLPDGCDSWGIKSVQPDLRTHNGYQWPFPGTVATAFNVDESNTGACPIREGDGLCVATSWRGMASGGIPARMLLLVAYSSGDVVGRDAAVGKFRCRSVAVVALVDGQRLLRERGHRADLGGADLSGAYLGGAYLGGADLSGADLSGAYLGGAYLGGADLSGAYLRGADLSGAYLSGADLSGAYLRGAYLGGADLGGAYLRGADLGGADLGGADLSGAYLRGAYLGGADLGSRVLSNPTSDADRDALHARGAIL